MDAAPLKCMFDTRAFNLVLDGPYPVEELRARVTAYATHIQRDEISNTKNPERKAALLQVPFVIFSLCVNQQAAAEILGAEMAKNLVSGHTWIRSAKNAVAVSYWSWKSDGTVCLRLYDKQGKCDDTGRWKMDGQRVCYELGWWGGTWGIKSACFRVSDKGKGRYEALEDNGIAQFEFTVSK